MDKVSKRRINFGLITVKIWTILMNYILGNWENLDLVLYGDKLVFFDELPKTE
jgi:hypothetical protein